MVTLMLLLNNFLLLLQQTSINLQLRLYNSITASCEKSKIFFLDSSKMKKIVVSLARTRFLVKLICCINFVSASNGCSLSAYSFL